MTTFTGSELAKMREEQESYMQDTAVIQDHARGSADAYGHQSETWTDRASSTVCGVEMKSGSEKDLTDKTLVNYDAIIRLPIGTDIDFKDRIKITKRFSETITAIVYEIVSPIQRGPSGLRILAKRTEY